MPIVDKYIEKEKMSDLEQIAFKKGFNSALTHLKWNSLEFLENLCSKVDPKFMPILNNIYDRIKAISDNAEVKDIPTTDLTEEN
jgi:uncharacterized protein YjgD (DUF1641 family)